MVCYEGNYHYYLQVLQVFLVEYKIEGIKRRIELN